jgi:hypothetical protein
MEQLAQFPSYRGRRSFSSTIHVPWLAGSLEAWRKDVNLPTVDATVTGNDSVRISMIGRTLSHDEATSSRRRVHATSHFTQQATKPTTMMMLKIVTL